MNKLTFSNLMHVMPCFKLHRGQDLQQHAGKIQCFKMYKLDAHGGYLSGKDHKNWGHGRVNVML